MAYVAPSTRAAGALITAAIWNQDVVANPIALFAGAMSIASQAANEIIFASSTTQLSRSALLTWDGTVLSATNVAPTGDAAATPTVDRLYKDTLVKAWASVTNTGTPALVDDVNVASLTDNAQGDTTVTFATALADANYCSIAGVRVTGSRKRPATTDPATGSVQVETWDDAGPGLVDAGFCVVVIGA